MAQVEVVLAVKIRRPVVSVILSGSQITLGEVVWNVVMQEVLKMRIHIIAAFTLNEVLRQYRAAAFESKLEIVRAGEPAQIVHELIGVLKRELWGARSGSNIDSEIFRCNVREPV